MTYKRDDFGISVCQVDGFGKNPGLWVCNKNCMIKVASFGSEEKSKLFTAYLDWLMINGVPPESEGE